MPDAEPDLHDADPAQEDLGRDAQGRGMTGARYCTQSIIAFRNLSAPARISAIVKALRRSRYAWYAGSARSAVIMNTRASRVATDGVGWTRT